MIPVSVVIPFYCHINQLRRALDSVAAQTILPCEVIIVNDGGGSELQKLLENLKDKFPLLKILVIELSSNMGASEARNQGWNHAKGEYIAFLDADDSWHPYKLAFQYQYMQDHPSVDISGHQYFVAQSQPNWNLDIRFSEVMQIGISLARMLVVNQFITPSVMIRANYPLRFESSQRYMEDYRMWLTIAANKGVISRIEAPLACIYKAPFGASGLSSHLWKMEWGEIKTYIALCKIRPIFFLILPLLLIYSCVKFLRRIYLSFIHKNH
ncbi:glycosyltransferase family 2 protein [Polynucleobacter sp. 15G-AUS-farblos]|uniref:glycosyltransferase family 2 protein n=1 Tax=Polynucleobacter sp. 15G-AUS-farblos TaxID=2689094 RepID=UPI001C0DC280|nr:glycosyltransferase family 2 protein [Polynucleobacter sp. 15G-AUS-farblos]MBU3584099.1 glycosyltransferase family 2 protein [Polynucleobacter sp. 15G-AUS-farblos]